MAALEEVAGGARGGGVRVAVEVQRDDVLRLGGVGDLGTGVERALGVVLASEQHTAVLRP